MDDAVIWIVTGLLFVGIIVWGLKKRAIKAHFAKGWTWVESKMPEPRVNDNRIEFTISNGNQAQYLTDFDATEPYTRLKIETEGNPVSVSGGEPTVNLYFVAKGEDWQGGEGKRWWSKATCGPNGSLAVPLDPADWISVWGKSGAELPELFAWALDNIEGAGVTFGGTKGGAGKGWRGSGMVTVTLN